MQIREARESLLFSKKFGNKKTFENFEEFVLANAMFKNSILSYAKCFSSSGTGKISIDANEIILSHTVTYKISVGDFDKYFELFDYCSNFIVTQVNKKTDKIEYRLGIKIKFN
ncbi:hypothetical protein ACFSKN_17250 [Mariniflexile gromovii]|uniref:Uncharacterized protein n=1 Tax=Mariniflexile gromovii TaxID=362523 RepID=A0ABS4BPC2_9FLAO|nr:hypothetical protein [Mariniflexile gromovii]MBP0902263.1 hypothetical protein [Mariniflexile gromovii]